MDADLQDPPELVPEMLARLDDGADIVHTVRKDRRSDSMTKRYSAKIFYLIMRNFILPELPLDAGDFKAIRRPALEALRFRDKQGFFLRGTLAALGFEQVEIGCVRPERIVGKSKYPFGKVVALGRDAIISNSVVPLRLILYAGLLTWCFLLVFLFGCAVWHVGFSGITNPLGVILIALMSVFAGAILVALGILGEYIGCMPRLFRDRPCYVARSVTNLKSLDPSEKGIDC